MYEQLKKLIPKAIIKSNEKLLRNVISIFYRGNNHQCNICNFKMSKFIALINDDKLCPKCGSLARTRRLWNILENKIEGKSVLHFSPSTSLRSKMESIKNIQYVTSDYAGEFKAAKRLNIEAIDEPNATYDLVVCYHVLEHLENDIRAMKELHRILKSNGECIIPTPFKSGEIYENENIKTEEERLIHFGQKDHLRIYSVDGLMQRLESAGFKTELKEYDSSHNNNNGYKLNEKVIIAGKTAKNR